MRVDELFIIALKYLEKNPYRFNAQEKSMFMEGLKDWVDGKSETIDDVVYDFLVDIGLYKKPRREDVFVSYLNQKYGVIRFSKILDVGAGRMCKLSEALAKYGNTLYAIDPNIRLSQCEANKLGIKSIKTQQFVCDKFAKGGKGTPVDGFDFIFGLEPCDATEHIIRQGLAHDKPFDVFLCGTAHDALNGRKFRTYKEWYKYLESISSEVNISRFGSVYVASNTNYQTNDLELGQE